MCTISPLLYFHYINCTSVIQKEANPNRLYLCNTIFYRTSPFYCNFQRLTLSSLTYVFTYYPHSSQSFHSEDISNYKYILIELLRVYHVCFGVLKTRTATKFFKLEVCKFLCLCQEGTEAQRTLWPN